MNIEKAHEKIKQTTLDILSICMELNSLGMQSFVDYSGHVNWLRVTVNKGHWQGEKLYKCDAVKTAFTVSSDEDEVDVINYYVEAIESVKSDLIEILEHHK